MPIHVLLLGTSRLHRPFARRTDGEVETNTVDGVQPVFAKIGYMHAAAEVLQAIRHAKHPEHVPRQLRSRAYRIEPRATTPLNEFDSDFEEAVRSGRETTLPFDPTKIDVLIMEVSSLSVNTHVPTGLVLHTNPNFDRNVPYPELYPEGYYAKFDAGFPVVRSETSLTSLTAQLCSIRAEIPGARVLVMAHLRSARHPNSAREKLHELVSEASAKAGCDYVDTAPFLDEFGFAAKGGAIDQHHLSLRGETALGQHLQQRALHMAGLAP